MRRVTCFLWELGRCHTQALARAEAGGGLLRVKRFGKLKNSADRRPAMCRFQLPRIIYLPKFIRVSFTLLKASYIGRGLFDLFVVGFHEPAE